MTVWFLIDIAVLFLVTLLTGIIIPQILLIAFRKNLFDEPDPRKIHKTEVPRLGGIAFFPSILFALSSMFNLVTTQNRIGTNSGTTTIGSTANSTGDGRTSLYTVDADGDINFPILGRLHVAGITTKRRDDATDI